jgi:two-component system, cell cycle response regulator DivK
MNVKIMVIEDNPQNAYLVKYLLEREGFAVHVAATAKDGLRWMKKSPPDCLLLDIQLPDMDGYSVAKESLP